MLENKKSMYLGFLDGLRAISIIFVVIYHYNNTWLKGGFLGVDIFFVISGFIITQLLYTEYQNNRQISFRAFYVRRFHRILPAMMALIAAILAFSYINNSASIEQTLKDAPATLFFFLNWKYILTNNSYFATTETPPLLEHLWSLSIEFQFYIMWPFIFASLIKRGTKLTIFYICLLAILSYLYMGLSYQPDLTDKIYFDTLSRVGAFFVGSASSLIFNQYSSLIGLRLERALRAVFYPILVGIIFLCYSLDQQSKDLFQYGFFANALLVALLLISSLVILNKKGGTTILDNGLLKKIGVISYSLYLWHWPIICLSNPLNDLELIKNEYSLYMHFAGVILFTLIVSITSYYVIEKPFRGVKKWSTLTVTASFVILIVTIQLFPAQSNSAPINTETDSNIQNISTDKSEDLTKKSPILAKEIKEPTNKEKPKKAIGGFFFKRSDISYAYQENGYVNRVYVDKSKSVKRTIYAIGDSVMLGASGALLRSFPCLNIDAKVGRNLLEVMAVIDQAANANISPEVYVIHIGNNEHLSQDKLKRLNVILNQDIKIIFLNLKLPRNYESANNNELTRFVETHPNQAFLIDWRAYSLETPKIFGQDGMHLSGMGTAEYTSLIKKELANLAVECADES